MAVELSPVSCPDPWGVKNEASMEVSKLQLLELSIEGSLTYQNSQHNVRNEHAWYE